MNKLFSAFQAIQLRRVVTVVLAGVLAIFTIACSGPAQAKVTGNDANNGSVDVPGQAQPYEGGMNNFSDVDPNRRDLSKVDAKAKALRDRVQRNINEKSVDSVDQYVENYKSGTPLGERTKRVGNDIRRGAENATGDLKEAADRGSKNLGQNLDRGGKEASNVVDNAKNNAKEAGRDVVGGVKRAADKLSND